MADGVKYTCEQVKQILKDKGLYLLDEKYTNARTKMNLQDEEGYKYYLKLDTIMNRNTPMRFHSNNKHSYENVVLWLEKSNSNLKILDSEFKGTNTKYSFVDGEGYKYYGNLSDVLMSKSLSRYIKSNIYTIENIKHFININKLSCELITNEYINNNTLMEFKCECGKAYTTTLNKLQSRHKQYCNDCSMKYKGESRRRDMQDNINLLNSCGYILLDEGYRYLDGEVNIQDKNGYKYCVKLRNVSMYQQQPFLNTNPYTVYNINLYLKKNDIDTIIISDSYLGNTETLIAKCSCGREFETDWSSIREGYKTLCEDCRPSKSLGEFLVYKWLDKHNKSFIKEKTFNDCKYNKNGKLRFDFYLHEENVAIEIDGIQHFEPIEYFGGEESFRKQQEKDKVKDEYCKTNNIKLIRIPYWEFNKEQDYIKTLNVNLLKSVSVAN